MVSFSFCLLHTFSHTNTGTPYHTNDVTHTYLYAWYDASRRLFPARSLSHTPSHWLYIVHPFSLDRTHILSHTMSRTHSLSIVHTFSPVHTSHAPCHTHIHVRDMTPLPASLQLSLFHTHLVTDSVSYTHSLCTVHTFSPAHISDARRDTNSHTWDMLTLCARRILFSHKLCLVDTFSPTHTGKPYPYAYIHILTHTHTPSFSLSLFLSRIWKCVWHCAWDLDMACYVYIHVRLYIHTFIKINKNLYV